MDAWMYVSDDEPSPRPLTLVQEERVREIVREEVLAGHRVSSEAVVRRQRKAIP
ncbi:hypothetical protein PQ455_01595 [Sphingomonas naphthae]|uniref:Transposase n=1 Tax=Sphingomonas naphthae TaxID=1813468 RepID=A0ABY7TLB1_9SPHN|nr:hypothetical protein [Sphingomonas naphthae]WCT73954.1 hypothetical protein PQ455_01595 [Sphingomonas naphthae]